MDQHQRPPPAQLGKRLPRQRVRATIGHKNLRRAHYQNESHSNAGDRGSVVTTTSDVVPVLDGDIPANDYCVNIQDRKYRAGFAFGLGLGVAADLEWAALTLQRSA